MRLAFDARMATWGGVGTYTRELLSALARDQAALGIERILAFRAPEDAHLEDLAALAAPPGTAAVEWRVAAGSPWSPPANVRLGLAARGRADVFHAPHFPVPAGFGGPLVTTIHDLIPLLAPDSMPDSKRRAAYSAMVRWAVTQSAVVICGTRAAACTVIQWYGGDTPVRVIHHGLGVATGSAAAWAAAGETTAGAAPDEDTATRREADGEAAGSAAAAGETTAEAAPGPRPVDRHGLRPGYVLWVGAFKPHKDVPTLLAAHRLLPPEVRDRHPLVLVGDDRTAEGRALRDELAASPDEGERRVCMLGPVAPSDLPSLYEAAAVFAFPSRIEGFGLPPLEAMAYGVPVVSSRAAPMPEVLGDAAAYFAPGNAQDLAARLLHVLTDPAAAAHLHARGATRARRYSWELAARETAAAYGAAVGLRRGRRTR